ncbi:hypothetical protein LJE71_21240, partial [Xanthobacter autotrophicus]|uniref:hypothetical protein n=1 Tax=Xanthobacter autotrophicus TaxID=280 RepID=UPI001E5454F8
MKNPKKIQDPTEAALSAIQEALTLELDNAEANAAAAKGGEAPLPPDRGTPLDRPPAPERVLSGPGPQREGRPINRRPRPPEGGRGRRLMGRP